MAFGKRVWDGLVVVVVVLKIPLAFSGHCGCMYVVACFSLGFWEGH